MHFLFCFMRGPFLFARTFHQPLHDQRGHTESVYWRISCTSNINNTKRWTTGCGIFWEKIEETNPYENSWLKLGASPFHQYWGDCHALRLRLAGGETYSTVLILLIHLGDWFCEWKAMIWLIPPVELYFLCVHVMICICRIQIYNTNTRYTIVIDVFYITF